VPTELVWDGKYKDGKKSSPLRISLPFQDVETVNESAQERQKTLDLFSSGRPADWRNRLIWGDKRYVLPSLLDEFSGKVDLIYIDPPFDTGADFSFTTQIPNSEASITKEPSVIEQKAYRDTWGRGLDSYLQWFYETVVLLKELLAETGSIYVHLDWHVGHYAKAVLDEVFGPDNFRNEIYWYYYNKMPDIRKGVFPRSTDTIFWYTKNRNTAYTFNALTEKREQAVQQLVRKKVDGKMVNARDEDGNVLYQTREHRIIDNVWRLSMLQPADKTENLGYATQKPETLLQRVVNASSNEGDLVLDCFCGSGTTAAVAEKLGRRWITCDLGRFAIHTTRKRLLNIPDVKPFVVQNLGKYERQLWQADEFGPQVAQRVAAYTTFILDLYHAQPLTGRTWLHGVKGNRVVHVGSIDSPVTLADVKSIIIEWQRNVGKSEVRTTGIDVLGWDFAFELNEVARQQALAAGVDLKFYTIPREVLEKKAVEQGDIQFFELAALFVETDVSGRTLMLELTNFVPPLDYVPQEIRSKITAWESWIDYWAIDFDFKGDTFHNEWQSYRTKVNKAIATMTTNTYDSPGTYCVNVKVIDILGNDTTRTLQVEIA